MLAPDGQASTTVSPGRPPPDRSRPSRRSIGFVVLGLVALAAGAALQIALLRAPISLGQQRIGGVTVTGYKLDRQVLSPHTPLGLELCFAGRPPSSDVPAAITFTAPDLAVADPVVSVPRFGIFTSGHCTHYVVPENLVAGAYKLKLAPTARPFGLFQVR